GGKAFGVGDARAADGAATVQGGARGLVADEISPVAGGACPPAGPFMASPCGSRLSCTGGADPSLVAGEGRGSARRRDVAMMYGRLTVNPGHAPGDTVARVDDHQSAPPAVHPLSHHPFPPRP